MNNQYSSFVETRTPLPMEPGKPERYDPEYERNGTASIFMFCEPKAGKRNVSAHQQRTMTDWAQQIKHLLDVQYPNAKKVVLVCDNLNTHKPAALYKTFPPEQARRLLNRLEIHYTPKHGSWLNIAEIELATLTLRVPRSAVFPTFLPSKLNLTHGIHNAIIFTPPSIGTSPLLRQESN